MVSQPAQFTLTLEEAQYIQALQYERQARFARQGTKLKIASIIVPVVAVGLIIAIDWFAFNGAMPFWFFFGLFCAYLFGFFTLVLVMRMSMADAKKRMLLQVQQVWEPRTVSIGETGLSQVQATSRAELGWPAVASIDKKSELLIFWLANLSSIVVPIRAFAGETDAEAFEAEARRLVGRPGGCA